MKPLADFIIRNRGTVLAAVVILTLFLGYEATKIKINADYSTYLREDDLVRQFNRIGEVFGENSMGMVLLAGKDIFSYETLNLLKKLTATYNGLEGISYVTSLTNVIDFKSTEGGLEVGELLPSGKIPESKEELERLKSYVLSKEMYAGKLVSKDGKATIILLRFAGDVVANTMAQFKLTGRIREVTREIASGTQQPLNIKLYYGGMPFLIYNMTNLIASNIKTLVPLVVFILLFVLVLAFKRPGGVLLPISVVLISVIWTVGLMALFDLSLDMLSGIMPIILLAMGSADGIHLMKRYYERRGGEDDAKLAVKETFSEMGVPIVLTTVTTMVGFSSLVISQFSVIRQFGLVTALGVFFALVVTLAFLPPLLAFSKERPFRSTSTSPKGSRKFTEALGEFVYRRKKLLVIAAGLIVILAAIAIPRIKRNIDWALCLKRGSDPYHAEMLLREKFGGSTPIQILVKGDIKNPATLKAMRYLEKYLETLPYTSNFQSIADVIAEMNEVMTNRYRIPEAKEGVANLWFFIEDEEITKQLVAIENTEALIQGRLRGMHTKEFAETTEDIEKFLKRFPQRIAVLDLRQTPPELRKALLELRQREITDKILWDLKKRGIEVDRKGIEASLRSALMDKGWLQKASVSIQKSVAEYLLSPESEVEFNSRDEAESIAETLGDRVLKGGEISAAEITALVRSKVRGVSNEDVEFLSQSLKWVIWESIGGARVGWMLRLIVDVLLQPLDDKNLLRDLKGDLWDANDNLITLNWQEYERLSAQVDPPLVEQLQVAFHHTGLVPIFDRMEKELMPTQIETLLLALVAVILLLALIHRSFVGGFIAVLPISLTILVNFAVMGYLKIDLDSWTAMIASIAIGLGIDTDIHFISRLKKELALDGSYLEALKRTLGTTGISIIINALAVGLGFMVLLFASGQHVRRIGGLVALTILLSALFTLIILPSILLWVKPRFLQK